MRIRTVSLALCTLVLAACGSSNTSPPSPAQPPTARQKTPTAQLALDAFAADCSDFRSYASDALTEQYLAVFACFAPGPCPVFAANPSAPPGAVDAPTAGGAAPERVSQTNTQEDGVDEADIVKADSTGRVFVLSGRTLSVVQAFPPDGLSGREVQTLDLGAGNAFFHASDFFLDEPAQRLVILGNDYAGNVARAVSVLVDVSDGFAPAELGRLSVDGYGIDARRTGGRVHRVSRFDVPAPAWFYDGNDPLVQKRNEYNEARGRGDEAAAGRIKGEIRAEIGQRVDAQGADFFLPRVRTALRGQAPVESRMACQDLSRPEVTTGLGIALVDSFGSDGSGRALSGVVNNAYIVYASASNLYLAQSSFGWFFAPQQAEETAIYRLSLPALGAAVYSAVGKVDGSVIGRYAFSEHDGYLRVASTETRFEEERTQTYNHVTVLRAPDLGQAAAVRDLAPGERIQGVRFAGDRGYVVTFRQVDPLFAIDLSNPLAPAVASVLKIPGFSSYLMPIGEDYLLTIGRSGNEERLDGAVGIQLFDVRNLAAVTQVAAISPQAGEGDYSWSAAEYDPHAFTYFADSAVAASPGTLSVPLQSWGDEASEQFAGFLVVRVDPAAAEPLRETGRISHGEFTAEHEFCADGSDRCSTAYQYAEPRRSVFMQDGLGTYLYTISALGLLANDAAAPHAERGRVALPFDEPCCYAMPVEPVP